MPLLNGGDVADIAGRMATGWVIGAASYAAAQGIVYGIGAVINYMPIIPANTANGQKMWWNGTNDHWISLGNYLNLSSNTISQTASYAGTGSVIGANVYLSSWSAGDNLYYSDYISFSRGVEFLDMVSKEILCSTDYTIEFNRKPNSDYKKQYIIDHKNKKDIINRTYYYEPNGQKIWDGKLSYETDKVYFRYQQMDIYKKLHWEYGSFYKYDRQSNSCLDIIKCKIHSIPIDL